MLMILLSGCAGNEQWRQDQISAVNLDESNPGYRDIETYRSRLRTEPGDPQSEAMKKVVFQHKTAYVEFDEQGDFFDRQQLADALANTPQGKKRLVIFYAHGWQNNTRSGDVAQFNAFLAHLNHVLNQKNGAGKEGEEPWEVYGVYLSWRGALYDPSEIYPPHDDKRTETVAEIKKDGQPNPLNTIDSVPKQFTFWSRKGMAARFSGAPLLETINFISAKARTDGVTSGSHDIKTRVVLMGHSFGAYVIEKTVLQAISTLEPSNSSGDSSYVTPPADFVILLNSAAPSVYAKEFIEFLKWHGVAGGDNAKVPFIVSVTSDADLATKDAFPLGTIPEIAFDVGSYRNAEQFQGANQKTFFTQTPGHNPYLISFDAHPGPFLAKTGFKSTEDYEWIFSRNIFPTDFGQADHKFLAWGDADSGKKAGASAQLWSLDPVKTALPGQTSFNDTPYWIIRVPAEIIADHGDVWSPNSMNLLTSLVRLGGLTKRDTSLRTLTLAKMARPKNDTLVECLPYGK